MTVGVLRVRLILREAYTLKDKRSIVKGIKERVQARFHVAIAEVGDMSARQRAELGVAAVSNDRRHVEGILEQVLRHIIRTPGAEVASRETEFF